jgi:predicted outer membrane repeat protein
MFFRANSRPAHRHSRRAWKVEYLEGRTLLSNFSVTNLNDAGDGSLRQAIIDSNNTTGPNEINFATGLSGTITLTSGELLIANHDVKIVGPGQNSLSVSGNGNSRVFETATGVIVTLSGMTVTGGMADVGGGIFTAGALIIIDCTINGNFAGRPQGESQDPWLGGGIYNEYGGTLTITNCTISGNSVGNTPTGNYIGGDDGGGIYNNGVLMITHCTITGNSARDESGGGIYTGGTVTITDSYIGGNSANYVAGGIYNRWGGTLLITNCTIAGNSAQQGGSGIVNNGAVTMIASTVSGNGGSGIVNGNAATINACTISGNSTSWRGGGIWNSGTMSITASTVAGNSAVRGGGGIANYGKLRVASSTVSGNSSSKGDGGIFNYSYDTEEFNGTVTILTSIVAGNSAPAGQSSDVEGGFHSLGHNLIGNTGGSAGWVDTDLLNIDPKLGQLQDNGGPTMTMALLPGSPAIDAGSNDLIPAGVQYDQRGPGFQRIVNATGTATPTVDIGAFEWQPYVSSVAASWGSQTAPLKTAADGLRVLPVGRKTDLPWLNINKLTITLSTPEILTPADVTVSSASGRSYGPVTLSGSGTNYTITLAKPISRADRVTFKINLGGMVTSTFELDVLPGDVNDDGVVNVQDAVLVRNAILKTGDPLMIGWVDVDGNGVIDMNDLTAARKRLGTHLQ